jgi:hypothetical protein
MITIGEKFPSFEKKACVSIEKGKEFETLTSDYLTNDDNVWILPKLPSLTNLMENSATEMLV